MRCGARWFDEAERALSVAVKDEVFAEEAHLFRRVVSVEFNTGGDGVPVAAHQFAHWRTWADAGESFVLFYGKHGYLPL